MIHRIIIELEADDHVLTDTLNDLESTLMQTYGRQDFEIVSAFVIKEE